MAVLQQLSAKHGQDIGAWRFMAAGTLGTLLEALCMHTEYAAKCSEREQKPVQLNGCFLILVCLISDVRFRRAPVI